MAEIGGGELQTLISTLQSGNTQLGHITQALGSVAALSQQIAGLAQAALSNQMGGVMTAAPLPAEPEGYVTVNIPGVGPRLVPYYPV